MEKTLISEKVTKAINNLLINDTYLLEHDLNERSITHKLAEYLQQEFLGFNVDCEYNGNITRSNYRGKNLNLHEQKDKLKNKYPKAVISVYPDIIVHQRGTNDNNLLLIEVKKSSSRVDSAFDLDKLRVYTIDSGLNKLGYEYGIFLKFKAGQNNPNLEEIIWFQNGEILN
ncbi:MAG: hypothetical protein AABZ74_18410 [Cyanobacteriota bacterium]